MFITEKFGPLELVSELLCGGLADETETACFGKYRHNSDLCPGFRNRILRVLSTYQKHRIDVHDIQGFQDKGVDVAVKMETDAGTVRIGLQIKSEKEIVDWKNKRRPNLIANIRNQYTQAQQEANVDQLYLVLCADAVAHRDHLRALISQFFNYKGLKIVLPEAAFSFFSMNNAELDVAVTRRLCARDFLLREARRSLKMLPPGGPSLALKLIFRALSGDTAMTQETYEEYVYDSADEANFDEPDQLMAALNRTLVEDISIHGGYRIVPDDFPAICALYYDQLARHGNDREKARVRTSLLLLKDA